MKEVMYNEYAKEVIPALTKGALIGTSDGVRDNLMTVSWGSIGYMWYRPIFTLMVRPSRFTYELLEKSDSFTVNIPLHVDLKDALRFCGTKSGRDINKWEATGLTKIAAHKVSAPLVENCDFHFECKIVGKSPLHQGMLAEELEKKSYSKGDHHVLYYGEIVGTYIK
jgi:flavin reductase (DIM6/NTAB) family NADH-FMN oxidoreductase RutF